MVRIVAKLQLKEGSKEKFIQLAKELIAKSQEEAGCIDYNLYQSQSDENTVTFIEAWKDMKAIESHNTSIHFTTIFPKLGEYVEDTEVTLYDMIKQ
jgi:quinol monooxygenase YgiN